ncbi:MAG: EAL domain-containing protein [Treponema sp.]|nr:EAL domain-containing protein [Treponema sp.]
MARRKSYIFNSVSISLAALGILFGVALLIFQFIQNGKEVTKIGIKDTSGKVLYISSYDSAYNISDSQKEGLEEVFLENDVILDIVYMDMMNYDTLENYNLFYNSIKYKINSSKIKYDAIVVSDDIALRFAEKYQDELFSRIPIVFFGVQDVEYAWEVGENPWITGSIQHLFLEDTLELAIEQNPRINSVIGLFDDSASGQGAQNQFYSAVFKYPNLDYYSLNLNLYDVQDLAKELDNISERSDSVVICMASLQDYARRNSLTSYSLVNFIEEHCGRIPVYRTNREGLGAGFVGGKIMDYKLAAVHAANTVIDILNGKKIINIPVYESIRGVYWFDYESMKNHNIALVSVPKGSIVINKEPTVIEKYGNIILPFIIISFSLVVLLSVALVGYSKVKKSSGVMMLMNRKMRQTNKALMDSKTKLTYIAKNDSLTSLPNRRYAEEEINKILDSGIPFSIFLMDIDDFKNYNSTYTHTCGDFILREFGKRLQSLVLAGDYFVARYGGDEFLIVHKNGHIEKNGKEIEKLRAILNEPLMYNGVKLDVHVSLGFADSNSIYTFDDLVTNADIALSEAKKIGKEEVVAFSAEMRESVQKKNKIIEILKEECVKGGFEIHYQPQINVKSGEVYGFEALVRLQDYQVGPGEFIPVAEDGGFIPQIGRIVTEKVVSQMSEWRKIGMPLKRVAINYSNGQLVDEDYINFFEELLNKYDIPGELFEIEITESLFVGDSDRARKFFNDLSNIGVGLALDDFGTGYSSLSYLTYLPAQKVKIDKSIVDNYLVEGKESFIQNIVYLVHDLGMKLTVEGVEQKWQYDKLKEMNCDYIQGYFFSKPMQAEAVPSFSVAI